MWQGLLTQSEQRRSFYITQDLRKAEAKGPGLESVEIKAVNIVIFVMNGSDPRYRKDEINKFRKLQVINLYSFQRHVGLQMQNYQGEYSVIILHYYSVPKSNIRGVIKIPIHWLQVTQPNMSHEISCCHVISLCHCVFILASGAGS